MLITLQNMLIYLITSFDHIQSKLTNVASVLPTQFYFDHARPALETLSERVVSNAGHPAVNDVDDTETPLTCIVSDATDAKTAIGTQKYS